MTNHDRALIVVVAISFVNADLSPDFARAKQRRVDIGVP